jgi:hypothetical protein
VVLRRRAHGARAQDAVLLFGHSGLARGAKGAAPRDLLHWDELHPSQAPARPPAHPPARRAAHRAMSAAPRAPGRQMARWRSAAAALTDHNKPTGEVAALLGAEAAVAAVVDHHNDEDAPATRAAAPREIDPAAGSTCTPPAHRTAADDDGATAAARRGANGRGVEGGRCSLLAEMMPAEALDPALCALMLGALAADCRGFDPALHGVKYSGCARAPLR